MASVRSSESLVVTAGVLATGGDPSLPLVIAAADLGAFTGARVLFGRRLTGDRLSQPAIAPGSRKRAALERATRVLANRGGSIIGVRRYIRGAHTAVTLNRRGGPPSDAVVLAPSYDRLLHFYRDGFGYAAMMNRARRRSATRWRIRRSGWRLPFFNDTTK